MVVLFSLLTCKPNPAMAQLPPHISISANLTPILAVPWGDFGGDAGVGASTGVGYAVGATVTRGSLLGVYGEYHETRFGCDKCDETGLNDRVRDTGWEVGLLLEPNLPLLRFQPWARGGIIGHQLEFSGTEGPIYSKPGFGVGLGAGIDIPLSYVLALSPSIRVERYSAKYDFQDFPSRQTNVSYMALGLGLDYRF